MSDAVLAPPPGHIMVTDARGNSQIVPDNALPPTPSGITSNQSEVMLGQFHTRIAVGINAAVKLGVVVIPDKYLAAINSPEVVQTVIFLISLFIDAVIWMISYKIRKGRLNDGQASSPIVTKTGAPVVSCLLFVFLVGCTDASQLNYSQALALACLDYGPTASQTAHLIEDGLITPEDVDSLEAMNDTVGRICDKQEEQDAYLTLPIVRAAVTRLSLLNSGVM